MLIDFDPYQKRKRQREAHRHQLIEEIMALYRCNGLDADADAFFLQHVREGFPINILENIVARLASQRASG